MYRGILPEVPSFAQQMGRSIGKGLNSASDMFQKQVLEKNKAQDPYKQSQQARLQADSMFKQYSTRIKEIQNTLSSGMYGSGQRPVLEQQVQAIQDERDRLFGWSQKGEEKQEKDQAKETKDEVLKPKKKKTKFTDKNKDHVAKFDQLHKKFKGDEEEIRKILETEFDLSE